MLLDFCCGWRCESSALPPSKLEVLSSLFQNETKISFQTGLGKVPSGEQLLPYRNKQEDRLEDVQLLAGGMRSGFPLFNLH